MRYLRKYNESESPEIDSPIVESINRDVEDILLDISDLGYIVDVTNGNSYKWYSPSMDIIISTDRYKYVDMDEISETLIRLFDYMKNNHQLFYRRNPDSAFISKPATVEDWKAIGWGQLDRRNESAYNDLKTKEIRKIKIRWTKSQLPL